MATFTATIFSALPPQAAFAYLADVSRFDEWDPGITQADQTRGIGPQLGARYELRYRGFGLEYEIVEFEPSRFLCMVADSAMLTSKDTVEVTESDTGCTVTYSADVRLPSVLNFLDPILQKALDRNGNRAADRLAVALDGKRVYEEHESGMHGGVRLCEPGRANSARGGSET